VVPENTALPAIRDLVEKNRGKIIITTHTNPDGDAIGACLSLMGYLKKKGHDVSVVIPDPDPAFLHWMPFHENITVFTEETEKAREMITGAAIIFCVDFNGLGRLSKAEPEFRQATAVKILIDHHTDPKPDFDHVISVVSASSTCELIYTFIEDMGDAGIIDRQIGECIYAGIVTDTGSFSYSCNNERPYIIASELVKKGVDGEQVHRLVYDTYSENRLRLLGYAISEKLFVLPQYHAAYISLTREDLERFHHQVGDTEDIVNFALSIGTVNLAALFYDRGEEVKVSLRSKGHFSVNTIARKYFNGGGHINAAGATSHSSLEDTVSVFLSLLPLYETELKEVY
jgi:phosphoesterase RecJ-like protein